MSDSIANNNDNRDVHPNSLKAIQPHQFKKGESGNVNGRPLKHTNLVKELIRIGNLSDELSISDRSYRDSVLKKIWTLASCGDKDMIKLLVAVGGLE
jgi:hypothetical protein